MKPSSSRLLGAAFSFTRRNGLELLIVCDAIYGITMRQWLLAACVLGQFACHSKAPESTVDKIGGTLGLSLLPSSVSLAPGDVFPVEVILDRPSANASPVSITVTGLPNGVSASPLIIAGNTGVFNLSASASASLANNAAISVAGTSSDGNLSASATLVLTVGTAATGFSLAVTPTTLRVSRGVIGSVSVRVIRHNFGGVVMVNVAGLPDAGVTADPLAINGNAGTLMLRVAPSASPGTSLLTVSGVSGSTNAATHLELVVLDPGGVDESFGGTGPTPGWVITHLDSSDGGTTVRALAAIVQPDRKILVAGNRTRPAGQGGPGCGPGSAQNCVALTLTRYNSDGTLDPSFGGQDAGVRDLPPPGVAILPEGSFTPPITWPTPQAMAFTDAGILVAAGGTSTDPDTLLRFTLEGALDRSFNPDGSSPGHAQRTVNARALAAIDDGGVLVAGLAYANPARAVALARYNLDGTLDATFGDGGIVSVPFAGNPSLTACGAVITDQKARVAVVTQNNEVGVMSFDVADGGSIDLSFNGTGQAVVRLLSNNTSPCAAVDLDGNTVVVAGTFGGLADIVLGSFQADGGLDPNFGDGGIARANLPPSAGSPIAAAVTTFAGKIVVVGSVTPSVGNPQLLIARYNSNGSPDLAFGSSGQGFIINVPNIDNSAFNAVTIQDDGKIVGAGNTPASSGQQTVIRYQGSTSDGGVTGNL